MSLFDGFRKQKLISELKKKLPPPFQRVKTKRILKVQNKKKPRDTILKVHLSSQSTQVSSLTEDKSISCLEITT